MKHTIVKTMLSKECRDCTHVFWAVGIGQGVRCTHPDNQKYKFEGDGQNLPVIISRVPNPCLFKVSSQRKKMILHIPHSSINIPDHFNVLEGVFLDHEFERMTDWFTDELFNFEDAKKLVFPYSRLYCDVERFRDDSDEVMYKHGMGVCYTRTSFGTKLREVNEEESTFIKSRIYDKHHKKLESLVESELKIQNEALIIDCHSFSTVPLPHEGSRVRPDICIGTDSFHTPVGLIELVQKYFENKGLWVLINKPFSGTMVPLKFYGKDKRVHSIMIEINRNLYLEDNFQKNRDFQKIKQLIHGVLALIMQSNFKEIKKQT